MMELNNKSQKSGDSSVNIQADILNVNTGPSIAHIKELALEVFENNFFKLAGVAKNTAEQRAREITEQFLCELNEKNPNGIKAADNPDFQYSLFIAQKEYAKCGDKELGDILVDILVDRSKEVERSLLQIVLNESLSIAPKLNSDQLDILACCFNVAYTRKLDIANIDMLGAYIKQAMLTFSSPINLKDSNYKHLEYVGCASIRTGERNITGSFLNHYQAIFSKGYSRDALKEIEERDPKIINVHIPCLNNAALIQAGGINDDVIREMCIEEGISEESINQLIQLNNRNIMNSEEAENFLEQHAPGFSEFICDANKSSFKRMELTSVGIAIAHAHSRKKASFDADLSIWI